MYKLNFNHLYYFLTIAREGSIVKASKKLNMTQPALSHQLKLLEDDLGKKLFDRVGRRLQINADGEAVRNYASKIFRHSEEMIQFLKSDNHHFIKIIKVGVLPWIPNNKVYDFLKPLIANQHIQIEVFQKDLDTLIQDMLANRLDLILCDSPYSGRSKKLQGYRVATDPLVCITSTKSKMKGKFPGNIQDKKIISYSQPSLMADKIDQFLKTNKITPRTVGSFTDSSLILQAVEKSMLIAFLPKSMVKESVKAKKVKVLGLLNQYKFSMWAITRREIKSDTIISSLLKNV